MSAQSVNRHLYLSPHLDDVPLSCAGLIRTQRAKGEQVRVVTFFTGDAEPPLPPLAQRFHAAWDRGSYPYAARRKEDEAAMRLLDVEFQHEAMLDAIYRRGTGGQPLYEAIQSLFGPLLSHDDDAKAKVTQKTVEHIGIFRPDFVYAPIGLGRHADHQAVIAAAKQAVEATGARLRLYEEWPYAAGRFPKEAPSTIENALDLFDWAPVEPTLIPIDIDKRVAVARCYPSQIEELFGSDQAMCDEVRDYAFRLGGSAPSERFWTPLKWSGSDAR